MMSDAFGSVYSGVTNPVLPKSMSARNQEPGFLSRFYKPKPQSEPLEDRYRGNQNLVLKSDVASSDLARSGGLKGIYTRLEDTDEVARSSSGSSQGSGRAVESNTSSGYGSEKRAITAPLHIELESEEEEGDTLVTGALHLQSNNNNSSNNQSKSPLRQSKSPIGQARSPIRQSKSPLPPPAKRSSTLSPSSSSKLMPGSMPDGLTNSISSFLKRTDHVSDEVKTVRRDRELSLNREISDMSMAHSYGRDLRASTVVGDYSVSRDFRASTVVGDYSAPRDFRASSVARASSVSRQFEPSSPAGFTRAGSVTRNFDLSSRDPYYSNISRASLSRNYRESSVPAFGLRDTYASRPLGLTPLVENKVLSPGHSFAEPSASNRLTGPPKQASNSRFKSLEEECNWILSYKESPPDKFDRIEEDENTLDDISGDEGFKSCCGSPKTQQSRLQSPLSEMTADLAEEQSANTIATERLETEQAERMKLERDKADLVSRNKSLTNNSERLEMELMHSRSLDLNGLEEDDAGSSLYRSKYERAMKELDHTKKLLNQQHEDDLEQLCALKKQLEKKLNDAYEEVDEQRQVVAQWKRKTQKIQGEMNDTRLLLEEQTSRNALLEKKQRKFDAELNLVQEDLRQETLSKDKTGRDLEAAKNEKNRLEEDIKSLKLDVESRDDRISSLQRDITELQMGGATEDEVRSLKKNKKDLEMQLKEQEEELDDLAAQVQMLEGSKTKLEMEMATVKKEHRRDIANKEEEIEEARASANKKVKILEQQLEQEHEERIMFLRERHDLEQKIGTLQDMLERSGDEEQVAKLKRDLKKTKALLRDAQLLVEKNQNDGTNKVILRQLKNQLEDAEFARSAAMKARQNSELELADTHLQLEDVSRSKQELEDRHLRISREKAELASQLNENEEELQEVMRKYKASVAAVSTDQITIQDQQTTIQELEDERNKLRDSVAELGSKLGNLEGENVSTSQHKRLELKIRELESKLELEITSKGRLDVQISRLKEQVDKLAKERDDAKMKDANSQEQQKKMSRQLRDLKEEYVTAQGKETELGQKKFDLEKQLEVAEAETLTVRSDLKLALKRVEDLQAAIAGEIDSDNSDDNSDSSDEEMHSFLEHHRRAMSVQRERESMARESVLRESILRESVGRDSVSMSREMRASVGRNFSAIEETSSLDISKSSIEAVPEGDESQA